METSAEDHCGHALTLAGALWKRRHCACVPTLFPGHVRLAVVLCFLASTDACAWTQSVERVSMNALSVSDDNATLLRVTQLKTSHVCDILK